jgi:hypothetical protein
MKPGVRVGKVASGAAGLLLVLSGCSTPQGQPHETAWYHEARPHEARPMLIGAFSVEEPERSRADIEAEIDEVRRALFRVRMLTPEERGALRRDGNERQIARASQLGVARPADVEGLVRSGDLVRLPDSTRFWVVRPLRYSEPYATPDVEALLFEIGERFHAHLDSLGVPPFRLEVTSVLRTPDRQAALRRVNRNASTGVSAHEFGTTIDIAYRRYAAPTVEGIGRIHARSLHDPALRELRDSLLVEEAAMRGAELQAVLGRVLRELREEGKILVYMEHGQTVYHMTVNRRFPRPQLMWAE